MEPLQYRYLVYREEEQEFRLLGYRLSLSPTEHELLYLILKKRYGKLEHLRKLPDRTLSRGSIPVHIHAINRKAAAISGRRLIIFWEGSYRLSPVM